MQRYEDERSMMDREIELLRNPNKLTYLSPTMPGLISIRTTKTYPFSNQIASWGQTVIMNCNTGDDFLYGPNCYLRLAWTVPAGTANVAAGYTMDFGYGSIMNVIREVVLTHSSGQVLEQVNYTNILAAMKTRWYTSREDQIKLSALLGGTDTTGDFYTGVKPALVEPPGPYNSDQAGGFIIDPPTPGSYPAKDSGYTGGVIGNYQTSRVNVVPTGVNTPLAKTYISMIPMSLLFGVFDRRDQLIPASLLAGATIQIRFETQSGSASYTAYSGPNTPVPASAAFFAGVTFQPSIVFDSCRVYDDVTRAILQEQSSLNGLQYTYSTYFPIQQNFSGTGVNFDVQYSASVTQSVSAVLGEVSTDVNLGNTNFNFPNRWTQYQWRIASDYKPFQPVIIPSPSVAAEALQYAYLTWQNSYHTYDEVDEPEGGTNIDLDKYARFASLIGTTLERSPVGLQLTGVPTNNSSLINLSATKTGPPEATVHNITVFLLSLRVANLRGGNVALDR